MALVHDVVEDVRGVGAVGEVSDFVDDEYVRRHVGDERVGELTVARGDGEFFDELGSSDEERVETVLDRSIGDGDRDVCLAASGLAVKDQRAPVGDEVGRQRRAEKRELDGALVGEVEIVDGLQEGKAAATRHALDAGLLAMRDLLGDEEREEVAAAPFLLLGARDEVAPRAACVGEMKTLEHRVDVDVGGVHAKSSC